MRLPVVIDRRGQRPDKPVRLTFRVPDELVVVGTGATDFPTVGVAAESFMEVESDRPGSYEVLVSAAGGYNDPGALIRVTVVNATKQDWRVLLALGPLLLGIWLLRTAVLGRRSRPASVQSKGGP